MMRLNVIAAGKLKEKYLQRGVAEYTKRLAPFYDLQICETREEPFAANLSEAQRQQLLTREGRKLLSLVPKHFYVIALDVAGKSLSSPELAAFMAKLADEGRNIAFIIGGPLGLSAEVRAAADERLSFSSLTFTHQMIRLLLVEQIYRAAKINRGEKYHY